MSKFSFLVTTCGGWATTNKVSNYWIDANDEETALEGARNKFFQEHGIYPRTLWVKESQVVDPKTERN